LVAPSEAPQHVQAEIVNTTSLVLHWQAPRPQAQHGTITKYRVRLFTTFIHSYIPSCNNDSGKIFYMPASTSATSQAHNTSETVVVNLTATTFAVALDIAAVTSESLVGPPCLCLFILRDQSQQPTDESSSSSSSSHEVVVATVVPIIVIVCAIGIVIAYRAYTVKRSRLQIATRKQIIDAELIGVFVFLK
jgi:hypothetical protein